MFTSDPSYKELPSIIESPPNKPKNNVEMKSNSSSEREMILKKQLTNSQLKIDSLNSLLSIEKGISEKSRNWNKHLEMEMRILRKGKSIKKKNNYLLIFFFFFFL